MTLDSIRNSCDVYYKNLLEEALPAFGQSHVHVRCLRSLPSSSPLPVCVQSPSSFCRSFCCGCLGHLSPSCLLLTCFPQLRDATHHKNAGRGKVAAVMKSNKIHHKYIYYILRLMATSAPNLQPWPMNPHIPQQKVMWKIFRVTFDTVN